jgi:alpha-ribazole phosphatase
MTQSLQKRLGNAAKQLVLVRHGRIEANHVGRLIGSTDVSLDISGESQAKSIARRVMRWSPQMCFCSPMQRCRQTAAIVAPDLPPQIDPELCEIDFGHWETKTFAEAAAHDPATIERWAAFDDDFVFPGGESVGHFLHRVHAAAHRLIQTDAETILVVTHGGVIRTMLCHLLGLEPRRYLAFDVPYAATVVVDLFDGKGVLTALERPDSTEEDHG